MNELDHYGGGNWLTPGGRALARDLSRVQRATVVGVAKADGLAVIGERIMTNTAALDNHRKLLARGDETLNALLTEVEVSTVLSAMSEGRNVYRMGRF